MLIVDISGEHLPSSSHGLSSKRAMELVVQCLLRVTAGPGPTASTGRRLMHIGSTCSTFSTRKLSGWKCAPLV